MHPARPQLITRLKNALRLDIPYLERTHLRPPERPQAAVLALLGFRRENQDPHLLLTRRSQAVETHKGQIALPGGRVDEGDSDSRAAALRETEEEVGIPAASVTLIGSLPALPTLSSEVWIDPQVGVLKDHIETNPLKINHSEVSNTQWVGLKTFLENYRQDWFEDGKMRIKTHVFEAGPYYVWGATAAMIRNLLDRMFR